MNEKKILRQSMLKRLKQLSVYTYEKWSNHCIKNLIQMKEWKDAKTIAVTISFGKEVSTNKIIEQAFKEGKTVCVPKCNGKTKEMTFYSFISYNQLQKGYADILEPDPLKTDYIPSHKIDLLIVPGVVFQPSGHRIGYGGGFYDRFLSSFNGKTLSVVFDFQVISSIPIDQYDLPVSKIITNKRIVHCD